VALVLYLRLCLACRHLPAVALPACLAYHKSYNSTSPGLLMSLCALTCLYALQVDADMARRAEQQDYDSDLEQEAEEARR
jgi:hypothetical protein